MKQHVAEYLYSVPHKNEPYLDMFFAYRGYEYYVTRALSWTACSSDYLKTGSMAEWKQHKEAQETIDARIKAAEQQTEPEQPKEWKYEGSAQEGLDLFWKYIDEQ